MLCAFAFCTLHTALTERASGMPPRHVASSAGSTIKYNKTRMTWRLCSGRPRCTSTRNPSCYPQCTTGTGTVAHGALRPPTAPGASLCRCAACRRTRGLLIARWVRATLSEVKSKLRRLERRLGWNHAIQGDGPLLRRLGDLGGVQPLVAGAFGGVNAEWRTLLRSLVELAAHPSCASACSTPALGRHAGSCTRRCASVPTTNSHVTATATSTASSAGCSVAAGPRPANVTD